MKLIAKENEIDFGRLTKIDFYINDTLSSSLNISDSENKYDFVSHPDLDIENDGVASYNYILTEATMNKRILNHPSAKGLFKTASGYILKLFLEYEINFVIGYAGDDILFALEVESKDDWNDKLAEHNLPNNYIIDETKFRRIFIFRSGVDELDLHKISHSSHKVSTITTPMDENDYTVVGIDFINNVAKIKNPITVRQVKIDSAFTKIITN